MIKVSQIEEAIDQAEKRYSSLTDGALRVPALSSLNIRHLMNNLGAIATKYFENGVHKGGLFCSTVYRNKNLIMTYAADNWASDKTSYDKAEIQFIENKNLFMPEGVGFGWSKCDSLNASPTGDGYDLYLYDSDHSEKYQCEGLTRYVPGMADEFIFCVDDYDWEDVRKGTERGIEESNLEILFSKIFPGNDHDNEGWWNGFAVFLLKKKK